MHYEALRESIRATGLLACGAFAVMPGDAVPDAMPGRPGMTVILIGSAGSSGWAAFDSAGVSGPHPLARWTRERVEPIARQAGGRAAYPDDLPFLPFLKWAQRAADVHPSPLGLMIHPEYGLWHSYRAALILPYGMDLPTRLERTSPCASCNRRPCLHACPVGAFRDASFDSAACRAHLAGPSGAECLEGGCKARNACPVGAEHRYAPAQIRFHMAAFNAGKA